MGLVLVLCFAAASFLVLAIGAATERPRVRQRLATLGRTSGAAPTPARGLLDEERLGGIGGWIAALAGNPDASAPAVQRARARLAVAGLRKPAQLSLYLGGRIALAIGLPLLVANLPFAAGLDPLRFVVLMAFAAGVGVVTPSWLLDRRAKTRQAAIERGLPDALDLMVVCIESGLGLQASIARVAAECVRSHPALAEEFELVALETRAGRSVVEALRGLARRTAVPEVGALVAMLVQTERFGTSVADALRVHGEAMRRRRMHKAEEAAAKAPLKMLFPAGLFIFPATLLVIAGPGAIRLIETLRGG